MYEKFYGFQEKPFDLSPNPDYLFMSSKHEDVYTHLRYALMENKGFVVVTGEIGSGKTTLVNYLISRLKGPLRIAYLYHTTVSPSQFLKLVAREFEIPVKGLDKVGVFEALNDFLLREHAARRRVLLIVDEAQNLPLSTLEEIRLISNLETRKSPLWQIVLVGQPELRRKLNHPSLKQLTQRITVYCHLEPLNLEETKAYIRHRLEKAGGSSDLFTEEALEAVHRYSRGIPRLINLICDTALVYGFADELSRIGAEVVEAVVKDRQQSGLFFEPPENPPSQSSSPASVEELLSRLENLEHRIKILEALVSDLSDHYDFIRYFETEWKNFTKIGTKQ